MVYKICSFIAGFVFGSANWFFMYKFFNLIVKMSNDSKILKKDKVKALFLFLVKISILFGGCYFLIAVLKLDYIWFIAGVTLSLAGVIFVLYKKSL